MGNTLQVERFHPKTPAEQLARTVALIGQGIRSGAAYPPLILHARNVAALAPGRKNWLGQLQCLFNDFLKRWRYVKDPTRTETVTSSGQAIFNHTLGAASPHGYGTGDCDEATAAIGALAGAIGMGSRIVVMAGPSSPLRASHVYAEINVPGRGWLPVDPVAWPRRPFGAAPVAAWRKRYDLHGRMIAGPHLSGDNNQEEGFPMLGDVNTDQAFPDYGLERFGLAGVNGEEPEDWSTTQIANFGAYSPQYGLTGGFGFLAEVEPDPYTGLARTPMLELGLADWLGVAQTGRIKPGCLAYGDDGTVYQFTPSGDGMGGFFSSIFKGAKKLVGGAIKTAKGLVHSTMKMGGKLLSKLPGGKYLVKIMGKVHAMAMKMVKPLVKFVGPIAKKLAPIAALIPGYGPAISAALYNVGKITSIMKAFDVTQDKHGRPVFKSGKQAAHFKAALHKAAEHARKTKLHKTHAMAKGKHIKVGTKEHKHALKKMKLKPPVMPAWMTQPPAWFTQGPQTWLNRASGQWAQPPQTQQQYPQQPYPRA